MLNKFENTGLSLRNIEKIKDVFSNFPKVKEVVLYGSRAKGNYNHGSDIDLSIVNGDVDFSELLKIENSLDNILLPYKIDLNFFPNIKNDALKEHILRIGIKLIS